MIPSRPFILLLLLSFLFTKSQLFGQVPNFDTYELISEGKPITVTNFRGISSKRMNSLIAMGYKRLTLENLRIGDSEEFAQWASAETVVINNQIYYLFELSEWEVLLLLQYKFEDFLKIQKKNFLIGERYKMRSKKSYQDFETIYVDSLITADLIKELDYRRPILDSALDASNLTLSHRNFISTYLDYLNTLVNPCDLELSEILRGKGEKFEKSYPESEFISYSNFFYTPELKKGFSVGMLLSTGGVFFSGGLSDYFSPSYSLGLVGELFYQRIGLSLEVVPSFGHEIKKEFDKEVTWEVGDKVGASRAGLFLSYRLIEKYRFNVSPIIGLMGVGISAPEESRYDDVDNILSSNSWSFGINLDWKFYHVPCGRKYMGTYVNRHNDAYWILRTGFAYQNPKFEKQVPDFSGNIFSVNLQIGFEVDYPRYVRK